MQRIFAPEGQLGVGAPAADLQLESFKSSLQAKRKGRSEWASTLSLGYSGALPPSFYKEGRDGYCREHGHLSSSAWSVRSQLGSQSLHLVRSWSICTVWV